MEELDVVSGPRKKAGPKPYPIMALEQASELPKAMVDQQQQRVRRLTLLKYMNRSPSSSASRELIATSAKYGLTLGNYNSEYIELTPEGARFSSKALTDRDRVTIELKFDLGIRKTPAFLAVYEKQRNKRVPTEAILCDLLRDAGVDSGACDDASKVFLANCRFVGLVQQQAGADYIIPIEQLLEDLPTVVEDDSYDSEPLPVEQPTAAQFTRPSPTLQTNESPTLHINIQIHIDPTSTPTQIDHIFSSMARHLYAREGRPTLD